MVALRSQGNWRWEGPLGTPLGLVHWKVRVLTSGGPGKFEWQVKKKKNLKLDLKTKQKCMQNVQLIRIYTSEIITRK